IAGSPGSVLLRSEDSGQNWTLIPTGVSSEIHRLIFLNENTIIAAGALGAILRSDDAGVTWTSVRAGGYRTALMNLASDFWSASEEALTSLCADRGIRSVTVQLSPVSGGSGGQNGTSPNSDRNFVDRQRDLSQIGVSTCTSEWLFFRSRPDHHRHLESLESDWDSQTDGQAKQLLTMRLARLIRIWKPTVILVDRCDSSDAVFQLTLQALPLAVRIAGESGSPDVADASEVGRKSSSPEAQADNEWCHTLSRQLAALNLPPWSVERIAVRCAPDRTSSLVWSDNDLLPALRTTSGLLLSCLRSSQDLSTTISGTESTSVTSPRRGHNMSRPDQRKYYEILSDASISVTPPDLFNDLPLRPGSDGRRRTRASDVEQISAMRQVVRSAQIESAAFEGHIEATNVTDAMIAELTTIGSDLPPALARKQLQDLAALHLRSEAIDSYLATLKELIRRYPSSPEALASAESLFLYYSSQEVR
ncbi:MAG: WD40/YVTN/BNR-like repeat-containing protein, partial [Planctomyces sp.]